MPSVSEQASLIQLRRVYSCILPQSVEFLPESEAGTLRKREVVNFDSNVELLTMTTSSSPLPYEDALAAKPLHDVRQQILLLYLGGSDLGAQVIGWTLYDGTGRYNYDSNERDEPIYKTGLDALRAGWHIVQWPVLQNTNPVDGNESGFLPFEFVFERKVLP